MPTKKVLVFRVPIQTATQFSMARTNLTASLAIEQTLSTGLPIVQQFSTSLPIVQSHSVEVRVLG